MKTLNAGWLFAAVFLGFGCCPFQIATNANSRPKPEPTEDVGAIVPTEVRALKFADVAGEHEEPVTEDGYLALPLVGKMDVVGLSLK